MEDGWIPNDWIRDFPAEQITTVDKVIHRMKGGFQRLPKSLLPAYQAQFVDTNFYYRQGGVDADKADEQNDILAIQYGIGDWKCDTFDEQVGIAKDNGQKYIVWIIPSIASSMSVADQVKKCCQDPNTEGAPVYIDEERPNSYTRYLNAGELRIAIDTIRNYNPFPPGCYSRVNILDDVFDGAFPSWFEGVNQWIAQYLLHWNGSAWVQYKYYNNFLEDWEWSLPPSVVRSRLYSDSKWKDAVVAWQFSEKGDAEYYIAPEWISPGQPGIKSCDLNVSILPLNQFMLKVFNEQSPPPPIPDPECYWMFETIRTVNYRSEPRVADDTYCGYFEAGQMIPAIKLENPTLTDFWLEFVMNEQVYYTALVYHDVQYCKPI